MKNLVKIMWIFILVTPFSLSTANEGANAKNVRMEFKGEQIERSRFSSSIETIQLSNPSQSNKVTNRLHSTKGDFKKEIKDSLHTLREAAW